MRNFGAFWGVLGHFGGILEDFGIGAFWGIASRWGRRGGSPLTAPASAPYTVNPKRASITRVIAKNRT